MNYRKRGNLKLSLKFKFVLYLFIERVFVRIITWGIGRIITWGIGRIITWGIGRIITWGIVRIITWGIGIINQN